ncbi:hypothetical protein BVER_04461c [Candidatus Burkholderia verschuerenii]|uniref:TrfB transcriptional repressor protein domain-containing protein n=1 Tax=Candidatus Burkholderia verschuerenii TaxID=242163 RepID=A0A0L0MGT7_9BURK|nr:TrfB-related DNA-binding protein [Candidatus Burkholderia verschuerenii]KND61511.1 hypothetical protein BVER_04461c [Candidatus Burkholderia verschuerenii]
MAKTPTMTADEFEALRPRLRRLALDTVDIARAVLVDGMTPPDVAARYGMTRQRVHGIVKRFRAAAQEVPTGWRRVEVWLPPEMAAQVKAMADKARSDHASSGSSGVSE